MEFETNLELKFVREPLLEFRRPSNVTDIDGK
jgi:hypothetical protein